MGEYGRIVGETSGATGGGGSHSTDLGGDIMGIFSDLLDQFAALPVEVVVIVVVAVLVAGVALSLRPS